MIGSHEDYYQAKANIKILDRELKDVAEADVSRRNSILLAIDSLEMAIGEYDELFEDKPSYMRD